jgi:tRNA-specific 2-thiouridylase
VNFAAEYKDRVFASFLAEYAAGRTPNPDVRCNAEIKFKAFLEHALALGGSRIATGHYAGLRVASSQCELLRGADPSKDQSYFLHRLNQAQLARVAFPLANLLKSEVRRIAREAGLPVHAKKDSTGICFIGERPFRAFLNRYLPRAPGSIRTPEGRVVGEHIGLSFYTIGQRSGLGIGGLSDSPEGGGPWYVADKDMRHNELIVVQGHEHPLLRTRVLSASDLAWISGAPPPVKADCAGKTRYRQPDARCRITALNDASCVVEFDEPQWAVTPGQAVVLYRGEVCLGGGVIQ